MAEKKKLVYAVAGEGRGHAAKSLAVASELVEDFDIHFLCGGDAFDLISKTDHQVEEIPFLDLIYTDDHVNKFKTAMHILGLTLRKSEIIGKIRDKLELIKPDLVIADFEYFVSRAAHQLNIPVLQISHQVVIYSCEIPVPLHSWFSWLQAYMSTKMVIHKKDRQIGVSFFTPPLKASAQAKGAMIIPPLIRPSLQKPDPEKVLSNQILVYFSCPTFRWTLDVLKEIKDYEFVVYGVEGPEADHITYKPFSPTTFPEDILASRAVVTNGGHNLLSETIYLSKPVFCFYVKGQFEQYLNTYYVEEMNIGRQAQNYSNFKQEFSEWMTQFPEYDRALENVGQAGNAEVKKIIYEAAGLSIED